MVCPPLSALVVQKVPGQEDYSTINVSGLPKAPASLDDNVTLEISRLIGLVLLFVLCCEQSQEF